MENQLSMTSMCQGSRLLGMSKSDEHTLESYFQRLVRNNGYEFVIDKLKSLKLQTIRCLENQHYKMPKDQVAEGYTSTKWSRSRQRPKGPLSIIYKTWNRPASRVRGIGMLINTITLDQVSDKQVQKLVEGINVDNSFADKKNLLVTEKEARRFVKTVNRCLNDQPLYDGTDLTGSLIPDGKATFSLAEAKRNLTSSSAEARHDAQASLSWAYDDQWKMAPKDVTDYIRSQFKSFKGVRVHTHTGLTPDKQDFVSTKDRFKNLSMIGRCKSVLYSRFSAPLTTYKQYAGTVSFLQKPGGKLRSVFNTNRVINYALKPYAQGIEEAFYRNHPHHIFVKRQDKGMENISRMLERGHTLTSADLTSATDRLNFRTFTNGLRKAILDSYGNRSMSFLPKQFDSEKRYLAGGSTERAGILQTVKRDQREDVRRALKAIDLFESIAESPFYSEDLGMAMSLQTGQPLGMMGSFQTLTAMNFCMGREAEIMSHGTFHDEIPQFSVVGDDFVGDDSIMRSYSAIVKACGGLDNHEKALHSNKYAEFCSHLITAHRIIPMKPRFHLGHDSLWLNAEKTSVDKIVKVYRLSQSDKQAITALAAYGDPSLSENSVPSSSHKYPREERLIIENALKQLSFESQVSPDPIRISRETEDYSRDVSRVQPDGLHQNGHGSADFRVYDENHTDRPGYLHQVVSYDDRKFSSVIDHYDHHLGERRVKTSLHKTALQKKKQGQLIDKLHKAYHSKDPDLKSSVRIPNHESSKVSFENLLLDSMSEVERMKDYPLGHPYRLTKRRKHTNPSSDKTGTASSVRVNDEASNLNVKPHTRLESESVTKKQVTIHNGSPFPSANSNNDFANPIDRSRSSKPNRDYPIKSSRNTASDSKFKIRTIPTSWASEDKEDEDSPDY